MNKTSSITFRPDCKIIGSYPGVLSEDDIRNEPMLFSSSIVFALKNGGKLTKKILKHIFASPWWKKDIVSKSHEGYTPVIDTKSVQLMNGWYPCIPGWHSDGVERKDGNSQPDVNVINQPIYHYICSFSTHKLLCPTLYVEDDVTLDVNPKAVWQSVDTQVDYELDKDVQRFNVGILEPGRLLRFNRATIHKGTQADRRGWRYFFRMSFYHKAPRNEVRNQVQVYMTDPNQGW